MSVLTPPSANTFLGSGGGCGSHPPEARRQRLGISAPDRKRGDLPASGPAADGVLSLAMFARLWPSGPEHMAEGVKAEGGNG